VAHAVGNNVGRFGYHQFARAGDAAGCAEFRIFRKQIFDAIEDVQGDALCGGRVMFIACLSGLLPSDCPLCLMFERISARADQGPIEKEAHPVNAEFRDAISRFFVTAGKGIP
jgi:hypothetical protein